MTRHAIAIAQTCAVILGSALVGVLSKLALRDVPPFTFVWLQIAIGGLALTGYTFWWRGERIPRGLDRRVWGALACIGICSFAVVRVLFMIALERLPVTTQAYLVQFVGVVTMLLSAMVLKERPSGLQVFGALLAIAGLRVFFREVPPLSERTGVILVAIGVLALAVTNILTRRMATRSHEGLTSTVVATLSLWIGGLPVVLVGLTLDGPVPVAGWRNWGILVLGGVVGIALGLTALHHVLKTLRAYEVSVLATTGVIFTALLAAPILGEGLAAHQVAGIATMLVGVGLVQLRRSHRG